MTKHLRFVTDLRKSARLPDEELRRLEKVAEEYPFRSNEYYQSLINWDDPDDPIRRIIVPHPDEMDGWGALDASNECDFTVMSGMQHKYEDTALVLANDQCAGLCRFCFRKRIFMEGGEPPRAAMEKVFEYVRKNRNITNVLVTGGDPLLLPTTRLEYILSNLAGIEHVRFIRIGSRMPVFYPFRITEDPEIIEVLRRYSVPGRRIYLQTHFNHPNELTEVAVKAATMVQDAGVIMTNQCPLLHGVNDDPAVLAELYQKLASVGIPPYYLFICRPTRGNRHFTVPVEKAYEIFIEATKRCAGPAKRARLVMSHSSGKIEVLGKVGGNILFRRHRAPDAGDAGEIMSFPCNPEAVWFDDYLEGEAETPEKERAVA